MELHHTTEVEDYAAAVVGFLEAEPCSRNILRGVIEGARQGAPGWTAPPRFWWVTDDGVVAGAVSWTPPYGVLVSAMPSAVSDELVESVRSRAGELGIMPPSVNGPRDAAEAVAAAWRRVTGGAATVDLSQLLHVLDTLIEPPRPAGAWRRAGAGDVDLCAGWLEVFAAEAGVIAGADPHGTTARIAAAGRLFLWVAGGVTVSMVAHSPPVVGVARVGPVYTPAEHRQRGYARRLTYEVTREALAIPSVTRVMLFTDVANRTSNSIYRQIGYRPVEEHLQIRLGG